MASAIPSTKHHLGGRHRVRHNHLARRNSTQNWKLPTDSFQNASLQIYIIQSMHIIKSSKCSFGEMSSFLNGLYCINITAPSWGSPQSWSSNPTHPGVAATWAVRPLGETDNRWRTRVVYYGSVLSKPLIMSSFFTVRRWRNSLYTWPLTDAFWWASDCFCSLANSSAAGFPPENQPKKHGTNQSSSTRISGVFQRQQTGRWTFQPLRVDMPNCHSSFMGINEGAHNTSQHLTGEISPFGWNWVVGNIKDISKVLANWRVPKKTSSKNSDGNL